jgi:glycerol uptake operon antiterminator
MQYTPPDPSTFLSRLAEYPCCPATTTGEEFDHALASDSGVIVILRANGLDLSPFIARAHKAGKNIAVHLDLVSGLRGDKASVRWLAESGADAVISIHGSLMAAIRQERMTPIQRLLLVRATQVARGVAAIRRSDPGIVEVLPGVVLPHVRHLLPDLGRPLLAGGFVRTWDDVHALLESGVLAVTSSTEELWRWPSER